MQISLDDTITHMTQTNLAPSHLEQLNQDFSFEHGDHRLHFKAGQGGIPTVEIQNTQASASISLQGAHVLSWRPNASEEVIWLSPAATYAPGKSIRGGIPICWPWFGAHESNADYPAHGFARTSLWQVVQTQPLPAGETQITFRLSTQQLKDDAQQMWPYATLLEYRIIVANTLTLDLTTYNQSEHRITVGQALHTYFNVNDVTTTTVTGLEGKDYLDKTTGFKRKTQHGPLRINSETDRIYLHTANDVIIDDHTRKIIIKKQGSKSTVVWNPWQQLAEQMGDLGPDGYRKMLCVESANAAEDTMCIQPHEQHTLRVTYELD